MNYAYFSTIIVKKPSSKPGDGNFFYGYLLKMYVGYKSREIGHLGSIIKFDFRVQPEQPSMQVLFLSAFFFVNLCSSEVERNKVFTIRVDELAEKLVVIAFSIGLPVLI